MTFIPTEIIDGVPIFKPTFDEFKSFESYIDHIRHYGMKSGIIKVIPPKKWLDLLDKNKHYLDLQSLQNIKIKSPIQQNISGNKGLYMIQNIEKKKIYNIIQWKNVSADYKLPNNPRYNHATIAATTNTTCLNINDNNKDFETFKQNNEDLLYLAQFHDKERTDFLEAYYWKTLNFIMPIYGADIPGSLFPNDFSIWNLNMLPNLLNFIDKDIPGVNHSYLYAGAWKSTFAWHLEDQDLYSINYIHFGSPKQWYSIPQEDLTKFESFIKEQFPNEFKSCHEYLRHKTILVSPQLLRDNNIRCNKIVHYQKEFIITFPHGYHAGFNYGYNLAEAVNFADEYWLDHFAPVTKSCNCVRDSVEINVQKLINNYRVKNPKYKKSIKKEDNSSNSIIMAPLNNNQTENLIQSNVSLRSTSPAPMDPLINQSSISRVSSPFLAKMMDLSNIIEPTLEDTTLKFNKKKINSTDNNNINNININISSVTATSNTPTPTPTTITTNKQTNSNMKPLQGVLSLSQLQLQLQHPRPSLLSQDNINDPKRFMQNHISNINNPIMSPSPLSPSILKDQLLNNNNNNNSSSSNNNNNGQINDATINNQLIHPNPMNPNRPNSAIPFIFDDNDDNLLAMSLTSLANSGRSSPKTLKPMLNTSIDINNSPLSKMFSNREGISISKTPTNISNDMKRPTPLRSFLSQKSSNTFRPLSPFNNLLTSQNSNNNNNNNNNNSNNIISNVNNSNSIGNINSDSGKITATSSSSMPFLKRTKSSNIVTLNISREGSRSPVTMLNPMDTNGPGSNSLLNKDDSLLSPTVSTVYPNLFNSNASDRLESGFSSTTATTSATTNTTTAATIRRQYDKNSDNQSSRKRPKKNTDSSLSVSQDIVKNGQKTNVKGSSVISPPGRFSREEVIVSESGKVYICQECKRKFSSGHHLTRHKKSVHSGEKPYSCPKCGKKFKRRDHVLQHLNKKIPCTPTDNEESNSTAKTAGNSQNNESPATAETRTVKVTGSSSSYSASVTNIEASMPNVSIGHDMVRQESEKNEINSPPITN
ncbi:hypothetical protein RI543_004953 [Arxiozyma heterogenica]|uniref:DNA damage-responsive transcriptional repressor RPH1 n=1 Tax=Arxiozyma heterogenica TaxID=278026 RepID=A0AAN7WDV6_9SACH|nr:hypothetical protein RI543_004953 [Kazachstania heterogenica]